MYTRSGRNRSFVGATCAPRRRSRRSSRIARLVAGGRGERQGPRRQTYEGNAYQDAPSKSSTIRNGIIARAMITVRKLERSKTCRANDPIPTVKRDSQFQLA